MTKDLMFKDEIQQLVAHAYRALDDPGGPAAGRYSDAQLAALPPGAADWLLGVGNPVCWADLRPGERVVDIGCGAGVDTLLAALGVSPGGKAVGVDFLPEMIDRASGFAAAAGIEAEFIEGEMEALPMPDSCMDVAVSNGAINLSARKSRVFAEAFRVLRPGGRLCVADLTIREEDLPSEILTHPSAWAG